MIQKRLKIALPGALGLLLALSGNGYGQAPVHRSAYHDYRVVTVADGLEHPWSIAFLPGGEMLVAEQPGRLRIVRGGKLLSDPVPGVPEVHYKGQGGLMDVIPHPDFAQNRLLYLSYSKPYDDGDGATTAVVRGRFEGDRLDDVREIFAAVSRGRGHYGSRLAFDAERFLFITVGDRQVPPRGELETHPLKTSRTTTGRSTASMMTGASPPTIPSSTRIGPARRSGATATGIRKASSSTPKREMSGSPSTDRKAGTS